MANLASAAFTTSQPCEVQLFELVKAPVLPEFLEFLDACILKNKDRDDRSEGGWPPEVDRIFKATGLAAPALAFLAMLRGSDGDPPTEVRQHFVQPTLRRVLYSGALHIYDRWIYEMHNLTEMGGCEGLSNTSHEQNSADLWLHPEMECLLSVCKAKRSLPTFVTMKLRMESFQHLVAMENCGYQHFKVSRLLDGAIGPLGDKASDWRMGLAWRNASSVMGDSMALQRSSMPFLLHAGLSSRRNLALCLSGQLRGRNSVADLQWVQRFGSFDIFAVVPFEDCQRTREILAELHAEVLCVDSLFMNPEELHWIRNGPKADPDICPGHHCVYVWRDVEICGRLLRRHMARWGGESNWSVGSMEAMEALKICMVSDFFHPGLGGVEMHIYQLSECLIQRGHKVIVLTHMRGQRQGVRYMRNGLKVYYLPFLPFHDNCTFPTFLSFFPLIRKVLLRERVDIVHGHQATSNLAHECLLHARTMGYHTVYTDHSLFGFADAACIHVNKLLKFFLTNVEHCICVSHTNRENLVLRAALSPSHVSVIPNAVDTRRFQPDSSQRSEKPWITVVVVSRLTYRKGVDLLVGAVPAICRRHPHVRWLIGGSGPKQLLLDEMIERENLHDRVELLGAVPHEDVRKVLVRGHIFLNTSLTEAFCIAIVEAAACGLMVVSTNVGGVPEVLPPHMTRLAAPCVDAVVEALEDALQSLPPPEAADCFHREVKQMYSWQDVAQRTERVYREEVLRQPPLSLRQRLLRFLHVGPVSGKLFMLLVALDMLLYWFLEWCQPAAEVQRAWDAPAWRSPKGAEPGKFRTTYWRVARMRLDLRSDIFPKDVLRAFADDQIFAYAIPDRQWIAAPDRFAIGPSDLMLEVYFTTYSWMLKRESWRHYDPAVVQACQRRGHLWIHQGDVKSMGKIWPCPEHSARGLAYQGPENVLEARLFSYKASITFRLRLDICFNQFAKQLGRILDSACEQRPRRHPHGYWKTSMKHDHVQNYVSRQVSAGSEKLETRLLPYDALFTARLAELLLEEWGEAQRPPKTLHLGAGRGAIAERFVCEQLSRWGLPVASVDGNCLVLALSSGLCLDVVDSWMNACEGEAAGRGFCRWLKTDKGSDWVLALNLIQDIPRHLITRLATRLASGNIIVISWMPARRLDHLKMRHLLQHLRLAGYEMDRHRSRELQLFGGLLCCPWNQNTLVLRKRRTLRNCRVRLLQELPNSRPCVLQQNYGCIAGGLWVHFGCRGRFETCGLPVSCESENDDYMECSASTCDGHDARVQPSPQMVGRLQRSDFLLTQPEVVSVNSSYFTQLFGLPLSHLYEAMDPLTTVPGVWKDEGRVTTVLLLRAVKLAVLRQLGSYGLGTFQAEWRRYATSLRGCQHPLVTEMLKFVAAKNEGGNWGAKEFLWQGIGFHRFGGFTFTQPTFWARYIYRFAYHASATG
eukprot:symbB.v1.2.014599.t1/scaffold1071.1/size202461/12